MTIKFSETGHLELINPTHGPILFDMIDQHREYLKEWMTFVDRMQNLDSITNFITGCIARNESGSEYGFVVFENNNPVGRNTIHKIDQTNQSGEIGYWLIPSAQSKGIISQSTAELLNFGFNNLELNRLEIRCGTGNVKSQKIPEKLGFYKEGIMREGERLNGGFHDLFIYSLLRKDFT